jgi:O-acetyl-ADP-ribose deacetylase (regulator of RNase III)
MSIAYKEGCLIEAFKADEVEAIAHQANCQNTMGSGVAKALRAAFPEIYEADCQTVKGDYSKLGSLSWTINEYGMLFNLYGQFNYGYDGEQYTDLEALESSFNIMNMFLDAASVTKVGLPKIGAGRGGADWDDIEDIIIRTLPDKDVTVYIK